MMRFACSEVFYLTHLQFDTEFLFRLIFVVLKQKEFLAKKQCLAFPAKRHLRIQPPLAVSPRP